MRTGWAALRAVLRSWGIQSPEQLSQWLRSRGFPVVRPGHHISARAQEYLLHEGCTEDARVALLETVFVLITLHLGRTSGVPPPTRLNHTGSRGAVSRAISTTLPLSSWESLDEVNLEEWFLRRVPIMKKCPHFLRGRLRQCFAVALRERQRARLVQDSQAEERAWKLFGLVPVMLLHRPRGTGSVGKDELMSRADNFVRGRWSELLNSARETYEFRSVNKEKNCNRHIFPTVGCQDVGTPVWEGSGSDMRSFPICIVNTCGHGLCGTCHQGRYRSQSSRDCVVN